MKRMSQSNKNTLTQKSKGTIGQTIVQALNKSAAQSIEPMSLAEIAAQERQLSLFDDAPIPSVEISTVSAKTRTAKLKSLAPVTRPLRICIAGYRSAPFGGGQGIYIKYLSKALVDAGHQVDVISGQPYPEVDPRVNLIKLPGLDLFNNGLRSLRAHHLTSLTNIIEWTGKLTGGFSEPYCFSRRLYKYLKSCRADYDIIHDNQCLGWGMLKLKLQTYLSKRNTRALFFPPFVCVVSSFGSLLSLRSRLSLLSLLSRLSLLPRQPDNGNYYQPPEAGTFWNPLRFCVRF